MTEQAPSKPAPAPKTTSLRVADPWCTTFTFPVAGGDTLVVDQHGIEVSREDAETIIKTAAQHGVTITEVSDK